MQQQQKAYVRNITIYCDASFDPHSGAAAWACWVKHYKMMSQIYAGTFRRLRPLNSTEAEVLGAANAVHIALGQHALTERPLRIVLVTDCNYLVEIYNPKRKQAIIQSRNVRAATTQIANMLTQRDILLKVNKVKAHSRDDGSRSVLNGRVDAAARKLMRIQRRLGVSCQTKQSVTGSK